MDPVTSVVDAPAGAARGVTSLARASLSGEHTMPLAAPLRPLLGDALVRGRTITCTGPAATSLASAVVVEAVGAGAWLAVVGAASVGLEALAGAGVALERVVRVEPGRHWLDAVGAALDGFDLVLTGPGRSSTGANQRLHARLRSRGAVLVVIDPGGTWPGDLTLRSGDLRWDGIEAGHGHLRRRTVVVAATGRWIATPRRATLELPAPSGRVAAHGAVEASAGAELQDAG